MAMHNNRTFFNGKSNFLQVALFLLIKNLYNIIIIKQFVKNGENYKP